MTRWSSSRASTGRTSSAATTRPASRRPPTRRADPRQGARAAGRAEVRRADRRPRRASGVRQERPLRAVRAVGHARRPAAGPRQAEDVEPLQDDDARTPHARRRQGTAAAAADARRRSCRRRRDRRQQRPLRTVRREGQGLPTLDNEDQLFTITLDQALAIFSPAQDVSAGEPEPSPPRARCASSAPTR